MKRTGLLVILLLLSVVFVHSQKLTKDEEKIKILLDEYLKAEDTISLIGFLSPNNEEPKLKLNDDEIFDLNSLGKSCLDNYLLPPRVNSTKITKDKAVIVIENQINEQGILLFKSPRYTRTLILSKANDEWKIDGVSIQLMATNTGKNINPCNKFEISTLLSKNLPQKSDIKELQKEFSKAENFACSKNQDDCYYIRTNKTELASLTELSNKQLPEYTSWRVETNKKLLNLYQETENPAYLKAATQDSIDLVNILKTTPTQCNQPEVQVKIRLQKGEFDNYQVYVVSQDVWTTMSLDQIYKAGAFLPFTKNSPIKNQEDKFFRRKFPRCSNIYVWSKNLENNNSGNASNYYLSEDSVEDTIAIPK